MSYILTASEPIKINLAPDSLTTEILQNLSMILQTPKYTAPLYRDFGVSGSIVDKPMSAAERDEATGKLNPCLEVEINVE